MVSKGLNCVCCVCGPRFLTVEGTSKNRIIGPGKILHFYNAPPDSTQESLTEVNWAEG